MNRGDAYKVAICNHTGTLAIYNKETDHFYSPIVDGPIKYDIMDKSTYIPNLITKYGKEFSIVEIPYSFKLLMQELTSMNVQMRLITADNIEQLTKEGDRRIYERDLQEIQNSSKEDIFERLKRENQEISKLTNKNIEGTQMNNNAFIPNPELLTGEEKRQILNMPTKKIQEFIESRRVSNLTPSQKRAFAQIIGMNEDYMRLEQEMTDNELYKIILSDEIDKMFEPTNSERALYKELYGENLNVEPQKFTTGTTFGGATLTSPTHLTPTNEVTSDKMIIQKEGHEQTGHEQTGHEQSGGTNSELASIPESSNESGTKVIKI
jgi:hypothetical protein